MTLAGCVRNGVVVFDGPATLPEGTAVRIEAVTARVTADAAPIPTLRQRYEAIIGAAPDLPADMAENHDHYIHGTPKR